MSSTKLAIGIVGLPNVGKSTLFKTLTKKQVLIANYPFATIDPNVGVVFFLKHIRLCLGRTVKIWCA